MARRWNNRAAIDDDINMICRIFEKNHEIPEVLVNSILNLLANVSDWRPGYVVYFYDELSKKCPEAVRFFK